MALISNEHNKRNKDGKGEFEVIC